MKLRFFYLICFSLQQIAYACPICATQTGIALRAGIFNQGFMPNLFYTVLPFIVFALIAGTLYFDLPSIKRLFLINKLNKKEIDQ